MTLTESKSSGTLVPLKVCDISPSPSPLGSFVKVKILASFPSHSNTWHVFVINSKCPKNDVKK
jgi:hypothetical protein